MPLFLGQPILEVLVQEEIENTPAAKRARKNKTIMRFFIVQIYETIIIIQPMIFQLLC
jgi:hypothetical protein